MKITNLLSTFVIILLSTGIINGQAFNTFENENDFSIEIDSANASNIWQIGIPAKTIFSSANTLPYALVTDTVNNYSINNSSSFQFTLDLTELWTQFPYVLIGWTHKMDSEIGKDGGIIEVSYDNTQTWINIFEENDEQPLFIGSLAPSTVYTGEQGISQINENWNYVGFCWSSSSPNIEPDKISLRFTFVSDSIDTNQEGWLIDNFEAYGSIIDSVDDLLDNSTDNSNFTIFPNPATETINIKAEGIIPSEATIQISDISGRLIHQERTRIIDNSDVDISNFQPGYYFLTIRNKNNKVLSTEKIIKLNQD